MQFISKIFSNTTTKNGIIFSFFSFLNNGINFLLLIIIASFINPQSYGKLNLFITSVTLLNFFICLNSTGIISVNYFRLSRKEFRQTINGVFLITLAGLIFFGAIVSLFSSQISTIVDFGQGFQWIVVMICFFQVFTNVNLDIWRLEEKPLRYGVYSSCIVLLNFTLTLLFVIYYEQDWAGRVYAQICCGFIFFILSVFMLIRRGNISNLLPTKHTFRDILSFGVPLIPHNISYWLRQGLDRYLINFFWSSSAVGNFSFAYNFANIIQLVGFAFNASNSIYIHKTLKEDPLGAKKKLIRQTKFIILFFVILSAVVCGGAYIFIPIFFESYIGALPFLVPLCIGALFQCIYLQFVNFIFYYKKTRGLALITFSTSLFSAICSYLFTQHSVYNAAYVSMIGSIVIAIFVFLYSRRFFRLF